jgi:hypothetical protein
MGAQDWLVGVQGERRRNTTPSLNLTGAENSSSLRPAGKVEREMLDSTKMRRTGSESGAYLNDRTGRLFVAQ